MTIRLLLPETWAELAPVFEAEGISLPCPEMARILVAQEGDKTIGFLVIQLQPHLEPLYVIPEYRNQGIAQALAKAAVQLFVPGASFFAFSPREGIDHLAEQAGLDALPWKIYHGVGKDPKVN